MGSVYRVNRVREMLQREFSDIVRHLKDPRVRGVTVVDTEISQDLRNARMFVSVIGSEKEQQEAMVAMDRALGFIRREVAQRVQLRYAPEIQVIYDDTSERAARVMTLLNTLPPAGPGQDSAGDHG